MGRTPGAPHVRRTCGIPIPRRHLGTQESLASRSCAAPPGLGPFLPAYPGLPPWANLFRPYGPRRPSCVRRTHGSELRPVLWQRQDLQPGDLLEVLHVGSDQDVPLAGDSGRKAIRIGQPMSRFKLRCGLRDRLFGVDYAQG